MRTVVIPWFQSALGKARRGSGAFEEMVLARGEIRPVAGETGPIAIACCQGQVWVTQAGDERDLILAGGQDGKTNGRGLVLVESLQPAVVRIFRGTDERVLRYPRS